MFHMFHRNPSFYHFILFLHITDQTNQPTLQMILFIMNTHITTSILLDKRTITTSILLDKRTITTPILSILLQNTNRSFNLDLLTSLFLFTNFIIICYPIITTCIIIETNLIAPIVISISDYCTVQPIILLVPFLTAISNLTIVIHHFIKIFLKLLQINDLQILLSKLISF